VFVLAQPTSDAGEYVGRLDDDDPAIRAALTSTATSVAFDPNVYRWTTTADDFDPDLRVRLGSELIEVASIATTAATFVAAGTMSSADNAAVTPALYAGNTASDWICVLARIRDASNGTLTTPAGYTRIAINGWSATSPMQLFVKVHSGTESNPTVTPTGGAAGDTVSAVTFGLRNMPITLADLNDAVVESGSLTNASAQNIAYPGLAVRRDHCPVDGCVVLLLGGKDDDWTSVATVSGFTEAVDAFTVTGNDQGLVVDYVIQTNATAVADGSFAVTGGAAAISGGAAVAFAGGFQTLTVIRSVNGVTKVTRRRRGHAGGGRPCAVYVAGPPDGADVAPPGRGEAARAHPRRGDHRGAADTARKTANETVNNSSVLQNDDVLLVPVEANVVYLAHLHMLYLSQVAAAFKYGFTFPAGATLRPGHSSATPSARPSPTARPPRAVWSAWPEQPRTS
jgi:hypothetical protein